MRPGTDLSQVEFFKLLSLTIDRWLRDSEVTSYDDLYDLVVLKHFKMTLPAAEQTNLSDLGIKKGSRAAGNYTLSQRGMGYRRREERTMTLLRDNASGQVGSGGTILPVEGFWGFLHHCTSLQGLP